MITIKPLEWEGDEYNGWSAHGVGHMYGIDDEGSDDEPCFVLEKHHGSGSTKSAHPTLDAAMQEAFADYSARIMSAIEPAGVGVETPPPQQHVACFDLPADIIESLLAIGPVEWGQTFCQSDEKHVDDFRETLRITREHFGIGAEETTISYVAIEGTGTVLANTGMSPRSRQHARILVGAWNQLVEIAKSRSTTGATILGGVRFNMDGTYDFVDPSPQPRASVPASLKGDEQ